MKENISIIGGDLRIVNLAQMLQEDGKQVYAPDFPIGVGYQNYENWTKLLKVYLGLGLISEKTTIIAHSIAPVFVSKFLVENKIKVNINTLNSVF